MSRFDAFADRAYSRVVNQDLNSGNRRGHQYDRKAKFQPGYHELMNIVAGLQKDVKRINQCLTIEGATAYAQKKGPNWQAIEDDITGPEGKPDGIKEVFVTDSNGNVRVINGWTLAKGTYPIRKAYYAQYPTRNDRRGHPLSSFKHDINILDWNGEDKTISYKHPLTDQFGGIQQRPSAKNMYKQLVFNLEYLYAKQVMKDSGMPAMAMAQIYNHALQEAYMQHVGEQVLVSLYGQDAAGWSDKKMKSRLTSNRAKDECFEWMLAALKHPRDWISWIAEAGIITEQYVKAHVGDSDARMTKIQQRKQQRLMALRDHHTLPPEIQPDAFDYSIPLQNDQEIYASFPNDFDGTDDEDQGQPEEEDQEQPDDDSDSDIA